jgi:hypothetical protein
MYQTVSQNDFRDAFRQAGRQGQFSFDGLNALFEHLEEYEDSTGASMELDVIAICCDFSEYSNAVEAAKEQGFEPDEREEDQDEDDYTEATEAAALEYLQDNTQVIQHDSGIIIQSF